MALTQVKSDGIATGAVTTTQIAAGAVTAADLENSGVTAGTYGSSSAIPAITVDAKGRITSASTNSVTQVGGATGVDFNDNVKARFGTGNDLEIYHDGSNSVVKDNGTGKLILDTDGSAIEFQKAGLEVLASFNTDGACQLYHDNSQKLATTSGGIDVTGSVTCDGLVCEGDATVTSATGRLYIQDNNSTGINTDCAIIGRDSSNNSKWYYGTGSGTDTVYLWNYSNEHIQFGTNNTHRISVTGSGHLIPNGGNNYDLGDSTNRWRNVYTNDLNLSNEGGANDVDGTWGSWTIQEGEDELFLLNRRNGKKYKFNLSEVN